MGDKILIMNFRNECIGTVERTPEGFVQNLEGEVKVFKTLPPIMQGIAPEPTQFPAAQFVLDYYKMKKLDVWEYLQKSNGFKSSRNVWFMAEPKGEVWIPLVIGMQKYSVYTNWFQIGDKITIQMNGFANVNRHSIEILPECIIPYLRKDPESRFSTTKGYVYDLAEIPSVKGLKGRLIFNFPVYGEGEDTLVKPRDLGYIGSRQWQNNTALAEKYGLELEQG